MSKEKEEQLNKKIVLIEAQIEVLQENVCDLKHQFLEETTGLKDGDKVVDRNGQQGMICYNLNYPYGWYWHKLKKGWNFFFSGYIYFR